MNIKVRMICCAILFSAHTAYDAHAVSSGVQLEAAWLSVLDEWSQEHIFQGSDYLWNSDEGLAFLQIALDENIRIGAIIDRLDVEIIALEGMRNRLDVDLNELIAELIAMRNNRFLAQHIFNRIDAALTPPQVAPPINATAPAAEPMTIRIDAYLDFASPSI